MPNSQDLNVLSICSELLESMDAGAAQRITQFLHSKFSTGLSHETVLIQPKKRGRPAKKKRGRPAKVVIPSSSLNGVIIEKKKRGRPAKKKRGRPAKVVSPTDLINASPLEMKKRGRPAKKKRGRPSKKISDVNPSLNVEVKKRGRPARKKRGRPAKTSAAVIKNSISSANFGRRGRPRKS